MPLSEHERRVLEEIEESFAHESAPTRSVPRGSGRRDLLVLQVLGIPLGLLAAIWGVNIGNVVGTVAGVVGYGLVVAATFFLYRSLASRRFVR